MTASRTFLGPPFSGCHRFPQLRECRSTPTLGIFEPFEHCLQASAARAAAPAIMLNSPKMMGVRGDITVISSAAGLPLSHPAFIVKYTILFQFHCTWLDSYYGYWPVMERDSRALALALISIIFNLP